MKMVRKRIWVGTELYKALEQASKAQGLSVDEYATKLLEQLADKLQTGSHTEDNTK